MIVITATFTATLVETSISRLLEKIPLYEPTSLKFVPFNQVLPQLIDENSLCRTNQDGTNIILLRFEDIFLSLNSCYFLLPFKK